MTLNEMAAIADRSYPDGWVFAYWDPKAQEPTRHRPGDSLAYFIASELHSVYDPAQSDVRQLHAAVRALDQAIRDLTEVRDALSSAMVDKSLDDWARKLEERT